MTTPDHDPFPELLLARLDDDALGMSMLIYPDRTPARNLFWLTLAVFVAGRIMRISIYKPFIFLRIMAYPVTVLRLLRIMEQIICAFCRAIRKRDMCVPIWIRVCS